MLCQDCRKQAATVFLKAAVNNKVTEMHLCAACAVKRGAAQDAPEELQGLLCDMSGFVKELLPGENKALSCRGCGLRYSEFRRTGRLGCPACYRWFGPQLRELLTRLHGGCQHAGRKYADTLSGFSPREREERLEELRAALKKAVGAEDFEAAARLRDEIKGLE